MVTAEIIGTSTYIVQELASLGKWLQAIGIIAILWLIFQVINLIINRKRIKIINKLSEDIIRLEKKIDKLLRKKKGK